MFVNRFQSASRSSNNRPPPPAPEELQRWIEAARAGERSAMGRLYEFLRPDLDTYLDRHMGDAVRRWINPDHLASEVLFETILALTALPQGAGKNEMLARLYQTAKSRIRNAVQKHRKCTGESAIPPAARQPSAPQPSCGTITREDNKSWLLQVVSQLKEEHCEVVRLCAIDDLSYVEAGQRLNLKPDTVRKRYGAAFRELKRLCTRSH